MELHDEIAADIEKLQSSITTIIRSAEEDGKRDLTAEEQENLDDLEAKLESRSKRLEHLKQIKEREDKAAARLKTLKDTETVPAQAKRGIDDVNYRQGGEPQVYNPGNTRDYGFLNDWVLSRSESPQKFDANERLDKHQRQIEERDANAASFAGMVVPQYLTDMADTAVRSMRPTADAMNMRPLPSTGMTLEIPRITTGATAAGTAELAAGSETDIVASNLTLNVKTVRGVADISYEAVMRGVMVDDLAILDLAEAVATQINDDVINGSSASQVAGLLKSGTLASGNVKTDADSSKPSATLVYSHTVDLATTLSTGRYRRVTHFVMAPRRFGYLAKATDSDGRPLYQSLAMTATNVFAHGDQAGAVGQTSVMLAGVPVIVDPAVPVNAGSNTNEDWVIGFYAPEMLLYESPLMVLEGDPDIRKWTHTITAGCFMAFAPKRNISAAAVRGTVFAAV